MNGLPRAQVVQEVVGARQRLSSACGIPAADIAGFRQPYLQASPAVRQVGWHRHPLYASYTSWQGSQLGGTAGPSLACEAGAAAGCLPTSLTRTRTSHPDPLPCLPRLPCHACTAGAGRGRLPVRCHPA